MEKKRNILHAIFGITLSVFIFLLYNISSIGFNYEVTHPSETETMYFSEEVINEGSFNLGLNKKRKLKSYEIPGFGTYNPIEETFQNRVALGVIQMAVTLRIMGIHPVIGFSLINLIGILFVFLLVKRLSNEKYGIIAALLFGCNTYLIFWNNFIYGNLLGVCFYIMGLYFFLKKYAIKNILFGFLFMYIFFLLRHEAVIYIVFAIFLGVSYHYKSLLKHLIHIPIYGFYGIMLISLYLGGNYLVYGKLIHVGYIANIENDELEVVETTDMDTILTVLDKYQPFRPRFIKLLGPKNAVIFAYQKIKRFIIDPQFLLFLSSFFFVVYKIFSSALISKKQKYFLVMSISVSLYFTFFESFSYHYGRNSTGISSFYSRYFIYIYFTIVLIFSLGLSKKIISKRAGILIIMLTLIFNLFDLFVNHSDGIMNQVYHKDQYNNLKEVILSNGYQPSNTKIVSGFFSKIFYEYVVIDPFKFYGFENNSMFSRTNKTDFDECILFEEIYKNNDNLSLLSIEYKRHRRSYLGLQTKYPGKVIFEDDSFIISEIDKVGNFKKCN